jgi:hypothetical protein
MLVLSMLCHVNNKISGDPFRCGLSDLTGLVVFQVSFVLSCHDYMVFLFSVPIITKHLDNLLCEMCVLH